MIARVVIDSPLPHLDRPFDYEVPPTLVGVEVGTRVRVPFAGRLVSAVVVEIAESSALASLKQVRSAGAMPSFTADAIVLARQIAERYGGGLWDVLRLSGAPRVASVERLDWAAMRQRDEATRDRWRLAFTEQSDTEASAAGGGAQATVPIAPDGSRRIVWCAPPNTGAPMPALALLGWAAREAGDGTAVVIMPDARSLALLARAAVSHGLKEWAASRGGDFVVIDADAPPARRYGSHLAAQRGHVSLVLGTRQAAWLWVPTLTAVAVWDESAQTLGEPRAPYPHARTVAAMRAAESAMLIAGYTLGADAIALVRHGFASLVHPRPPRQELPFVEIVGDDRRQADGGRGRHWMPPAVWGPLQAAAKHGVAAVLAPQAGIGAACACTQCGALAVCRTCGTELPPTNLGVPGACRTCGDTQLSWHCPQCRGAKARPVGLGVEHLADQLRRMVPEVQVTVSSAATGVIEDGTVTAGLVVATPGALPAVAGGYRHLAIVGAHVDWGHGLGAEAASVRRWLNAIALVAPRAKGGSVSIVGEVGEEERPDLVALDGVGPGQRDYERRRDAGLPPVRRVAVVEGDAAALAAAEEALAGLDVSVSGGDGRRVILASRSLMPEVVQRLRAVIVERSAGSLSPLALRVDAHLA